MFDADNTMTSRGRLIAAAQKLFSQNGYEQTSTASIAKEAGTSESQLVRYFGSKSGLLEALFEVAWSGLQQQVLTATATAPTARAALLEILGIMIDNFSRDEDLAYLMLFEGRRIRGPEHEVFISKGFRQFHQLLEQVIRRGHADKSLRTKVSVPALTSALLGAAEGMMRDQLTARRAGEESPFGSGEVREVFAKLLESF